MAKRCTLTNLTCFSQYVIEVIVKKKKKYKLILYILTFRKLLLLQFIIKLFTASFTFLWIKQTHPLQYHTNAEIIDTNSQPHIYKAKCQISPW